MLHRAAMSLMVGQSFSRTARLPVSLQLAQGHFLGQGDNERGDVAVVVFHEAEDTVGIFLEEGALGFRDHHHLLTEPGGFQSIARGGNFYGEPVLESILAGKGTQDGRIQFDGGVDARSEFTNVESGNALRNISGVGAGAVAERDNS